MKKLILLFCLCAALVWAQPTGTWFGFNPDTQKFLPVLVNASGSVQVEGIGGVPASVHNSGVDSLNEETVGSTFDDKLNYAKGWRDDIKAAIASCGIDMTGVKPSGYDAKITEAVAKATNEALFNFRASDKTIYSGGYNAEIGGTDCVIPDTIGGVAVEHIAYAAMDKVDSGNAYGAKLVSLILPDGLKTIGDYAFRHNQIAGGLAIPPLLTAIGASSFGHNLVDFLDFGASSSLTTIGSAAFFNNKIAGKLAFPATLSTIETACFQGNSVTELDLPSSLSVVGLYAFNANSIVKITIGANVAISDDGVYPTMGVYGSGFLSLYNGNGKLAGTYEYAVGTWTKTL